MVLVLLYWTKYCMASLVSFPVSMLSTTTMYINFNIVNCLASVGDALLYNRVIHVNVDNCARIAS